MPVYPAVLLLLAVVVLPVLSGCRRSESAISIAEQWGIAYLPVQIVKEQQLMEKRLPDAEIRWEKMGNAAAIREAMAAGKLDIGFMGIPPFLIGYDRGVEWRIFCGLSEAPLGLVTLNPGIESLEDIGPRDTIALPQPGSIQHILLSMASGRLFGEPKRFDSRLVTLSHPDGMQALLGGREITAHFTSPPYLFEELKREEARLILSGEEAFGGKFSFIVGVGKNDFLEENPEVLEALTASIEEAFGLLEKNRGEIIQTFSDLYDMDPEVLQSYIDHPGMVFSAEIRGLEDFINFMHESGYVRSTIDTGAVLYSPAGAGSKP